MIEELQFEISRLTRRMFLQTNYDATACYDRIIPNLAMLVSRRFGVPKEVTQSNAITLQQAKYHVRTELGLSESYYSHSPEWPIYGTGQGSGNSPMIWCFLSSLLFDCYDLRGHPAVYCNPDWTNQQQVSMIGFVDDSNGQVNSFYDDDTLTNLPELQRKARVNATEWSNLLQATGGALELSKCSYHIAFWKFSIQGAPVLSNIRQEITPLQVPDPYTGTWQTLEYLPPSDHCILVVQPFYSRGSLDILSLMLHSCNHISLDKLIPHEVPVETYSKQGNGNHYSQVRIQPTYKNGGFIRSHGIRWCRFSRS